MKASLKRRRQVTSQCIWVNNLNLHLSSGVVLFEHSSLVKDKGSIRLLLEHKELKEDEYQGEALPYVFENKINRNDNYLNYFENGNRN